MPAVVGGVEPELTVTAAEAVPVDDATVSTAAAPAADDRPAYSRAATPMSAVRLVVAVTTSAVPPPRVMGAVHTVISVASEATNPRTLV